MSSFLIMQRKFNILFIRIHQSRNDESIKYRAATNKAASRKNGDVVPDKIMTNPKRSAIKIFNSGFDFVWTVRVDSIGSELSSHDAPYCRGLRYLVPSFVNGRVRKPVCFDVPYDFHVI